MKNFTNNFKQFTSRLSARWLIMALMLLLGTSSAWAYSVTGGAFAGWGNWTELTKENDNRYVVVIQNKNSEFKLSTDNNYDNCWNDLGTSDANINLRINNDKNHKILGGDVDILCFDPSGYDGKGAVWTEDCAVLKHPWDGGEWYWKILQRNNDGTFSITAIYRGGGLDYKYKGSGSYIGEPKKVNDPGNGDECVFTFNPNDKSITITKVVTCETLTKPTLTVTDVKKCNTDYTDGKITISGYDANTYTYVLKNSSNQTVNKTYSSGYSFTKDEIGTYKVIMTRKDGTECEAVTSDSKEIKITDNTPAIGDFSVSSSASSVCSGTQVTLEATNVNGASYQWFLYGSQEPISGATSRIYEPTITANATYKVEVSKTANSCTATKNASVSVTAIPVASTNNFDITIPENAVYNGQKHSATATVKSGITGMGAVTVKHYKNRSEVDPIDAGDYVVKMSVAASNSYCAMSETQIGTFTINKANQTTPTITANSTNICGKEATFAVSGGESTGNYSYTFDKNDANATREGTTLKATQSGSVTLKVKKSGDNNYNDSQVAEKAFTFTMPIENVTLSKIEDDKTTYCVGDRVEFKLNYNGPYPTSYEWFGSAMGSLEATGKTVNVLDNGASWYIDFTEAKTYTIALSLTGCNTQSSKELSFTVNALPSKPTFDVIPAQCGSYTLPAEDKNQVNVIWYTAATGGDKIITPVTQSGTYYAEAVSENNCTSTQRTAVEIIIDKSPTISGETFTQPGKVNAIELTVPDGINAKWSVSPAADLSVTEGKSTMFSAEKNGRYTITATNGTCSDTHIVTVADAFYIYFRNAKEGETAYANFYDPNQNTEDVQGGEMFYAECDALPTNGNTLLDTHFVNYNKGGRKADIITTDCDGYTWYGFKASAEVVAGTKYFYVHATNDKNYNGHFTHTVPTKKTLTSDVYYTLGTTNHVTTYYGWNIVLASAPYAGPKVHASGSTTLGTDKFAALYVTDCSGKEITGYQWYKDGQPYSSVCSYVGKKGAEDSNAGETNNIRPTVAGNYSCTVTYEGGTTATSAAVPVTGTYSRSFTSNIPVLVVNTGSKRFPDCTGISGQTASRNASKFKEKRSVDVKIYDGEGALVYDRKARMNYRGSSSLNFVKKSYAFCPGDANCEEKDGQADYVKTAKLNMLGVGKACDKDWVLYAAAADPSLMRNRLVFDSYKAMTGKWGVNSRYVELIVDGVYKGVYVFMDKITMNTERVKVDEDKGFIVKFDKTDREDRVGGLNGVLGDEKTFKTSYTGKDDIRTYDTDIDQRFEIEYPEKDDYKTGWKARVDGIQGMFQAFEDALKQGDYATVQKYIDYTSWADWFIINEFTKNVDAYRASCIFVYTGEAGAKIEARPLWDQELSFNNQASKGTSDKGSNSTAGLLIQHSNVYSDAFGAPFWFTGGGSEITGGLLSDPCFVQVVKERWNMHQSGALSKKSLEDLVDEYEDDLAPEGTTENAQTRETTFWDGKSRGKCDCSYETSNATATGYQNKTFEESKGTITNWISDDAASGAKGRRAGLTTAINGLTGASFSIQILPQEAKTTPWEPVEITVSVTPAGYDYKLEYTGDNNLGGVANTIIKEEGDKIIYRIPRPDAWGTGNESVEGERTDIEYGIKATLSVQEGTTVCGSQAAPSSTGKIILQDEPNEKCD